MERTLFRPQIAARPGLVARFRAMLSLGRQRRHLHTLSGHLLEDIGITKDEARREAGRPIWDVPGHWKR